MRPRPPVQDTQAEAAVRGWLDPLSARVREPEWRAIARHPQLDPASPAACARALVDVLQRALAAREAVLSRAAQLRAATAGQSELGTREALRRHLRATVTDAVALQRDIEALDRDLDLAALLEREAAVEEAEGARIEVAARALAGLLAPERGEDPPGADRIFVDSGAAAALAERCVSEPRLPSRRAAAAALARVVGRLSARGAAVPPASLHALHRLLRDPSEDIWTRRAALEVTAGLDRAVALHWLEEAAASRAGREAWLLRARAVELLAVRKDLPHTWDALERAVGDLSETVRAALVDAVARRVADPDDPGRETGIELLARLLRHDGLPRVRARAAWRLGGLGAAGLVELVPALTDQPLVARFAIEAAHEAAAAGQALPAPLLAALQSLHERGPSPLARAAALALEAHEVARSPLAPLAAELSRLGDGETRQVALPEATTPLELARSLVPYAARGYGFWLDPLDGRRVRVHRGERPGATLWRLLHELRHPGPAKRQGWSHTQGRVDLGAIRVPPYRLAEESATGVPGQRVLSEREGGWAPEVPMVEDAIDALQRGRVHIATAEGVTTVDGAGGALRRVIGLLRLTWRAAELDALRVADLHDGAFGRGGDRRAGSGRFVEALARAGVHVRPPPPPGAALGITALPDPVAFAVNVKSSSALHLAITLLLLVALTLGRSAWVRRQVRRARASIPLVVGGWGTRGKSGTERMKAGLLEGLGVPFLSKTTGCEAMILHAPPGGHAMELFLFRPYDKATIWEQTEVVRLAPRLGARAMLWECMGLNPGYVDILQQGWMRDDLSTLTNAYPDHEDIQGPTGLDVARTIAGFCPSEAALVTTEQNMLPVIATVAAARGTALRALRPAEHQLLPADLLARLPYLEHPANVALAASVAEALGVPKTEAIGLMAEHAVPDLGALVLYPRARHMDREVDFANGMSANDRLSWLHSWRRAGFDRADPVGEPDRWLVTVVNNRADRVARSRVFAQIVAEDAAAHRHVLIGTNLTGLVGYIGEAADARLAAAAADADPQARTLELFDHLRLVEPVGLAQRCAARLGAPPEASEAWRRAVADMPQLHACALSAAREAAERARPAAEALAGATTASSGPELAGHLVEALARWLLAQTAHGAPVEEAGQAWRELLLASLVVIEDPATSGDQIVAAALGATPPGAEVHLLGMQNIKGTGLDFAYLWVHWRTLQEALSTLGSRGATALARRRALSVLETTPITSLMACEAALPVLAGFVGDPDLEPQATSVLRHVERRAEALRAARARNTPRGGGPLALPTAWLERLLDPIDAILRRRRARQVFEDLAEQRVSHPRAAEILKALTDRQKGGWLARR